jgi:hypothetical protein
MKNIDRILVNYVIHDFDEAEFLIETNNKVFVIVSYYSFYQQGNTGKEEILPRSVPAYCP